eukprot:GHVR01112562.1.p1 GENE.GHVR01112562.1~~GHVR01112562.1.p1  ORF type:complete len:252 (-),score=22.66 GHVR01112562.1:105-860(-)
MNEPGSFDLHVCRGSDRLACVSVDKESMVTAMRHDHSDLLDKWQPHRLVSQNAYILEHPHRDRPFVPFTQSTQSCLMTPTLWHAYGPTRRPQSPHNLTVMESSTNSPVWSTTHTVISGPPTCSAILRTFDSRSRGRATWGNEMSTTEAVRSERARDKGRRTGRGRTESRRLSEWAGVPRGGSGAAHTYIFPRTLSVDTFKSLERLEAREREPPSEDELELMAFLSEERDSHSSPHSSLHKSGAKDGSTQVT